MAVKTYSVNIVLDEFLNTYIYKTVHFYCNSTEVLRINRVSIEVLFSLMVSTVSAREAPVLFPRKTDLGNGICGRLYKWGSFRLTHSKQGVCRTNRNVQFIEIEVGKTTETTWQLKEKAPKTSTFKFGITI